jgi:hypothetical protein
MPGNIDSLASVIAAHLREWEGSPPFVELAIFATTMPGRSRTLSIGSASRIWERRWRAGCFMRLCGATFTYACAYTARCGHALGGDERARAGGFQNLLWNERAKMLDL